MPEIVIEWRAEKDLELLNMMGATRPKSQLSLDHVFCYDLFRYKNSWLPITYPRVLTLRCSRSHGTTPELG